MPPSAAPPQQRLNPRRTKRSDAAPPPCPALVRQSDRKVNFVDNLVDSAAQIVEVIWPLSVVACRSDAALGAKAVLPLRTFIQETLRRSRTSYSTLQVALYYLIVIKPHVPTRDFTMEQPDESHAARSLQCGRRMFLAALILASKYLQDRNYSARAWSKISGLNTQEVNMNELTFLGAVDWRLHISEPIFQRWTDIVLKYTPSSHPPPSSPTSSPLCTDQARAGWCSIIPKLTPQLDTIEIDPISPSKAVFKLPADFNAATHHSKPNSPPPSSASSDNDGTPTPLYNIPRVLEPQPRTFNSSLPPLPPAGRLGPLPTPQMTPQMAGFNTPAASVLPVSSKQSSIGCALARADATCIARMTLDRWPSSCPRTNICPQAVNPLPMTQPLQQSSTYRRSSRGQSSSSDSSPESMISDTSSISSRSSSISSVSSSICAPNQATLAVQATCRSAKLHRRGKKENWKFLMNGAPGDEIPLGGVVEVTSSPESFAGAVPDLSNFTLATPKDDLAPFPPRDAAQEAAHGLRDFVANQRRSSQQTTPTSVSRGRKRGRNSEDMCALQRRVRKLCSADLPTCKQAVEDSSGTRLCQMSTPRLTDAGVKAQKLVNDPSPPRLPWHSDAGNDRTCRGDEAKLSFSSRRPGPGMWEGIL